MSFRSGAFRRFAPEKKTRVRVYRIAIRNADGVDAIRHVVAPDAASALAAARRIDPGIVVLAVRELPPLVRE